MSRIVRDTYLDKPFTLHSRIVRETLQPDRKLFFAKYCTIADVGQIANARRKNCVDPSVRVSSMYAALRGDVAMLVSFPDLQMYMSRPQKKDHDENVRQTVQEALKSRGEKTEDACVLTFVKLYTCILVTLLC